MRYVPHGSESALAAPNYASPSLPQTVADAEKLVASIERAVWRETGGRIRNLRVEVHRHEVLLTGRCDTYYAKQMAQHAAMSVHKAGQLTNQIEVLDCAPQEERRPSTRDSDHRP
jgi:osmotically-inducible protein OsmY